MSAITPTLDLHPQLDISPKVGRDCFPKSNFWSKLFCCTSECCTKEEVTLHVYVVGTPSDEASRVIYQIKAVAMRRLSDREVNDLGGGTEYGIRKQPLPIE